jgi:hypothetical protein
MSIRDSRRSARALVLAAALALAALPAHAMPMDGASGFSGGHGAFTAIFETLRSVWLNVWGKSGLTIDPDGRPRTSGMTNVFGNEGMSIDPSGRPTGGNAPNPEEGTDEGMLIDPHG